MHAEDVGRPIQVLMVEDNPDDVDLTAEALSDIKVRVRLDAVDDGVKALAYLRREDAYATAPRPDIILLDLNLPKKHGHEVLREIKGDEDLGGIPVVVLTTSADEQDILKSYRLHANCYVTKPVDFDEFTRAMRIMEEFWFSVAKLPGR